MIAAVVFDKNSSCFETPMFKYKSVTKSFINSSMLLCILPNGYLNFEILFNVYQISYLMFTKCSQTGYDFLSISHVFTDV